MPWIALAGGAYGAYHAGERWVHAPEIKADRDQRRMQRILAQSYPYLAEDIQGDIAELNKLRAEAISACQEAKRLAQEAKAAAQSARSHKEALNALMPAINDVLASRPCDAVPGLKAAIDEAMGSNFKDWEDKVVKGIEWAQAAAADCDSADTAEKIDKMYKDCKALEEALYSAG